MKFFFKVLSVIIITSLLSVSLGGFLLINSNINALFNKEIKKSEENTKLIISILENEFNTNNYKYDKLTPMTYGTFINTIKTTDTNNKYDLFLISKDKKIVFSSKKNIFGTKLIDKIEPNKKAHLISTINNKTYIGSIEHLTLNSNDYYIETVSDISYITSSYKNQKNILFDVIIISLIFIIVISLIFTYFLIRPISSLSNTTKAISKGNLEKRVIPYGNDEFYDLAKDFNSMADSLEDKIIQLEDETEKKELFIGAFSHEIKTPLTSVIGYADILRSDNISPEKRKFCANYIFEEGKRLELISMRLLDLIVLDNHPLKRERISISDFLLPILDSYKSSLNKVNINISWDVEDSILFFEKDLFKIVIINLIENAKKAAASNGTILINGFVFNNDYILKIEDFGKGIKKEDLTKIKEAFYMVDKSRNSKNGSGLGLTISDKILNLHNYPWNIESEYSKGTIITITMKGATDNEQ